MFDTPIDAWYVWFGVGTASVAALGVVLGLPAAAPPDATGAADAVDAVASAPPGATTTHDLDATEYRIDRHRIALRTAGGTAGAAFAYGPVTPAPDGRLARLRDGAAPSAVFDSPAALATTAGAARARNGTWRPAPDELRVRRVEWGEVDVTLVG